MPPSRGTSVSSSGWRVDAEAVAPELDDGVAAPRRGRARSRSARAASCARRLEPRLDLVGPHRVAELAQPRGEVAQLQHHRVGREVGVELVGGRERCARRRDALEDALGRLRSGCRAALALVEQRLLARAERLVDLLALVGELGRGTRRTRRSGPRAPRAGPSAWRAARRSVSGVSASASAPATALAEELELGAELGAPSLAEQLLAAACEHGARAVELPKHLGDALEDRACARSRRRS